jgi:hypothetical protein
MDLVNDSITELNKMEDEIYENPAWQDLIVCFINETNPDFSDTAWNTERVRSIIYLISHGCEYYELPDEWFDNQRIVLAAYKRYFGSFQTILLASEYPEIMTECIKLDRMMEELSEQYSTEKWFDLGLYLEFNESILIVLERISKVDEEETKFCQMMESGCSLGGESN